MNDIVWTAALAAHLPSTTSRSTRPLLGQNCTGIVSDAYLLVSRLRASRKPSLRKFNCATVNREALRARRMVIAGTGRQSSRPARQGDYSVKTVRELSVGGPCITLGFVLRETASRISYRDRHGTSKFVSKRWAVHTEPCRSCPDCPIAKYPY
jgi:hypothetical protein